MANFSKKIKRAIKHPLEYVLFITVLRALRCFSIDHAAEICSKVARVIGPFLPVTKVARKNLEDVFGKNAETEKTIDDLWDNFGRVIGELPFVKTMSQEEVEKRVQVVGIEHIKELQDANQPFIFFTGHFANWEFALRVLDKLYPKFAIIYRKSNNRFISDYINSFRTNSDYLLIPKGTSGAKDLVKAIKSKYSIGMLVDQKMRTGGSIEVPFFDRPAKTASGVAELALRFGYPIIPFQIIRTGGSYFKCVIHPQLEIETSGDKNKDCYRIMFKINQILESWIIEHKEQWFWFHNRWGD